MFLNQRKAVALMILALIRLKFPKVKEITTLKSKTLKICLFLILKLLHKLLPTVNKLIGINNHFIEVYQAAIILVSILKITSLLRN